MNKSEPHSIWSHAQIQDYLTGRLPSHLVHELERDMLDDPFLADSVQGYKDSGLSLSMAALDDKWTAHQKDVLKGGHEKGGGRRDWSKYVIVALGVAFVGALLWTWKSHEELNSDMDKFAASQEMFKDRKERFADSLAVLEIKLAQPIASDEEIRPEETRAEQEEIQLIEEQSLQVAQSEPVAPEPRQEIPTSITPLGHETSHEVQAQALITPQPKVFYLSDLKLADYRKDYGGIRYIAGEWMSGTAARFERDQNKMTQIATLQQVDYETIMAEAMSFYSARDYKSALIIFNRIENRHPDDLNAAFYGGLCYFNLSKWSRADVRFRRAQEHPRGVFDQEAQWYLSRSLIQQGEHARAQIILVEIAMSGGFYAEKARLLFPNK